MNTRCMHRPAIIDRESLERLDSEYRAARWTYHRLLDFEDEHQRLLDATAEECAPGIVRVGRLVACLRGRGRRRERSTGWSPPTHSELCSRLVARLKELRRVRDADPRWKSACKWADTPEDGAPERGGARRRNGETDEAFSDRCAKRRTSLTRREARRAELYRGRRIYWGTWNALLKSCDQAKAAVLEQRKAGMPAEWRRPRWNDPNTIAADAGGFRIVERGTPWWTVEVRAHDGWVRFRAKLGNWHELPGSARMRTCKLTRVKDGRGWRYSVSIAVEMPDGESMPGAGMVALDWGHREHGHPLASEGIRAFTWVGDDGRSGEILLPRECRVLTDQIDAMKARVDDAFNARKTSLGLPERNRHRYRSRLMRSGVQTEEEARWLTWEMRYERRMQATRKRIANLREQTYLSAVRDLRGSYLHFVLEDEPGRHHRELDTEEQTRHRKRSNRDMVARYLFTTICERLGADVITVPAHNSTRECPDCGALAENGPDLLVACPGCGRVRDKDYGAARVILRREKEALANRLANERDRTEAAE